MSSPADGIRRCRPDRKREQAMPELSQQCRALVSGIKDDYDS